MDTRTKRLLIIGGVLAAFTFFIFISALFPQAQRPESPQEEPKTLTVDEIRLPEEKPQHLVTNSVKTGTLVVTANDDAGYVFIDQPIEVFHEGVPEEPAAGETQSIPLSPPFRIENISVGQHTLIAIRQGSLRQDINFAIKENEVTRMEIVYQQSY